MSVFDTTTPIEQNFCFVGWLRESGFLLQCSLPAMELLWKKIEGESKFSSQLLSEEIKEVYSSYKTIMKLWSFLGLLAITVACLGLLGTVSFTIKKTGEGNKYTKSLRSQYTNPGAAVIERFYKAGNHCQYHYYSGCLFFDDYVLAITQHYSVQIGLVEMY